MLTVNDIHFTDLKYPGSAVEEVQRVIAYGELFRCHSFALACAQNDIDHRLTKLCHAWTNGQVERMNRSIKEATVNRYHYDTHDQFRQHLGDFVAAYNVCRSSRPSKASPNPKLYAKRVLLSLIDLRQIQSIKSRDQTSRA
ncbi:integrase core domain-containing protein [Polymorphobacter megasporae]|nr:integrase core domain-containing protein [Polymorphobacter megasporae]